MGGATLEAWRVTASLQGAKRGRSLTSGSFLGPAQPRAVQGLGETVTAHVVMDRGVGGRHPNYSSQPFLGSVVR